MRKGAGGQRPGITPLAAPPKARPNRREQVVADCVPHIGYWRQAEIVRGCGASSLKVIRFPADLAERWSIASSWPISNAELNPA